MLNTIMVEQKFELKIIEWLKKMMYSLLKIGVLQTMLISSKIKQR
jgi:hypothetical protein